MFENSASQPSNPVPPRLPARRTFLVRRYDPLDPAKIEELVICAHSLQYTESGDVLFIEFTLVEDQLVAQYRRILRTYIDMEESIFPTVQQSSNIVLH